MLLESGPRPARPAIFRPRFSALRMPVDPAITIVLPAFNAASTLSSALDSLTRQTRSNWCCLVVDDGSTDATGDVAAVAASRDARIRVRRQPHGGIVAALSRGLAEASTPFVARMDADDLMHRRRLERQLAAFDDCPELALVGCHVRCHPRPALTARREYEAWLNSLESEWDVARDALVECPLAHPTWLARRSLFEAVPYRDVPWAEDYDVLLRALHLGLRLGVVPERLHLWRDHPTRVSRVDPRYGHHAFTACKAAHLARGFLQGSDRYVLWGYGDTGRLLRRALLAHGKAPAAIVEVKQGRIGQRIHGAPVISVDALARQERLPVVVSVARSGPRAAVRLALERMGFRELRDFVCAA